jgi:UDP-N-acetylmuramate dehydrogenase
MTLPPWLRENIDVTAFSAFKTRAISKYFFEITERDDINKLSAIIHFAHQTSLPVIFLGAGTNCLFAFDIFSWVIIRNRYGWWEEPFYRDGKHVLRIHSGEQSHSVAQKLYDHYSIATLIPWIGLPWTFGGATVGNAGCFGVEMSDICLEVEVLDTETAEMRTFFREDMQYAYRQSFLKDNPRYFVLSTLIRLSSLGGEYEKYTPENLRSVRKIKQPAGFSCGSFFMNSYPTEEQKDTLKEFLTPLGTLSSGRLIDKAWLKWTRIWWIKVSEQHGNFFINDEKATWQDILELRDVVKKGVSEKYGVDLHEEVRIITNV